MNLSYCTNIHAGESLEETRANLATHAVAVRRRLGDDGPLGVGLWLSARAARELVADNGVPALAAWIEDHGLAVSTINGFPYGDFHRPVVKHDVYRPDWRDARRLSYTLDLAEVLAGLIAPETTGSISTLPLGWRAWFARPEDLRGAVANLVTAAERLADLETRVKRLVHLDLEPEPGCVLQRSEDVVGLFTGHRSLQGDHVRRHLRVCHDICHAAVMFEDQAPMLAAYDAAGIAVGKVQVSSAVRIRFDALPLSERPAARAELEGFREERYLHQTMVRRDGAPPLFFEDLPAALAAMSAAEGEWRTHFHVPIHLERLGPLETTRDEIARAWDLFARRPEVKHFEVETYAWDVLPAALKGASLADDIACELAWFRDLTGTGHGA